MRLLAHACPQCSRPFIPWRVWAITHWSCISCPNCEARLNRKLDWRFGLLLLASISVGQPALGFLLASGSWPAAALGLAALLAVFWLVDVATVRLVVAGKQREISGHTV